MLGQGKVVGGHYINATVSVGLKGDLVVASGFKRRMLSGDEVAEWADITPEAGGGSVAAGAVGKMVAGAVLPGLVGKVAGAALHATLGSPDRGPRTVRVDWSDGKRSLIRLPQKLFTHLTVVLEDRQAAPSLAPGDVSTPAAQVDVAEQIGKLAQLRDLGALTEAEFASKKGELLARL
jgi:hypothetical protein